MRLCLTAHSTTLSVASPMSRALHLRHLASRPWWKFANGTSIKAENDLSGQNLSNKRCLISSNSSQVAAKFHHVHRPARRGIAPTDERYFGSRPLPVIVLFSWALCQRNAAASALVHVCCHLVTWFLCLSQTFIRFTSNSHSSNWWAVHDLNDATSSCKSFVNRDTDFNLQLREIALSIAQCY